MDFSLYKRKRAQIMWLIHTLDAVVGCQNFEEYGNKSERIQINLRQINFRQHIFFFPTQEILFRV